MKNNKKITGFLVITLLGIWGSIAYQVIEAMGTESGEEIEVAKPATTEPHNREEFKFDDNVRDPFRFVVKKDKPTKQTVSKQALWVPPPFRLTGIVIKQKEKLAVLEARDGTTFFLSEGETLNGVKLVKILDRSVTYKYMDQTRDWALAH